LYLRIICLYICCTKKCFKLPRLFDIVPLTQEQETCCTDNSQVIIRPLFGLKILHLKIHFCIDRCLDNDLSAFGRNMLQVPVCREYSNKQLCKDSLLLCLSINLNWNFREAYDLAQPKSRCHHNFHLIFSSDFSPLHSSQFVWPVKFSDRSQWPCGPKA